MSTAAGAKLGAGQFGDTTYTKVFVGGLAWETHKDTMNKYFEQFGDILEAVVITDKATGRSKGYGFVTFREAEAAMRACVDAAPVIDGRRANCNLASLGVQRSKPSTPKHSAHAGEPAGRSFKVISPFLQTGHGGGGGGGAAALPSSAAVSFPHYAIQQQGMPPAAYNNVYGYSTYQQDYTYPMSYYSTSGYGGAQYPVYGGGMLTNGGAFYPFLQFGGAGHHIINAAASSTTASSAAVMAHQSYSFQYPHQLFQYSSINNNNNSASGGYPQHYGNPISSLQHSGVTICMHGS